MANSSFLERDGVRIGLSDIGNDEFAQVVDTRQRSTSSNLSSVSVGTEPVVLLAANLDRLNATAHNHADSQLFISLGDVVSTEVFTQVMEPHAYYELPYPGSYAGVVMAMRPAGSDDGPVMLTEFQVGV